MGENKVKGNLGENFAAQILIDMGYDILFQNFRTNFGEMDIIAKKDNDIHFIEVKTRSQHRFGRPCESITESKKTKLKLMAEYFLKNSKINYRYASLDVFEIEFNMIENCI